MKRFAMALALVLVLGAANVAQARVVYFLTLDSTAISNFRNVVTGKPTADLTIPYSDHVFYDEVTSYGFYLNLNKGFTVEAIFKGQGTEHVTIWESNVFGGLEPGDRIVSAVYLFPVYSLTTGNHPRFNLYACEVE